MSLTQTYKAWCATLDKDNNAIKAQARRIRVDDVEKRVDDAEAISVIAALRYTLPNGTFGKDIHLALIPLFEKKVHHREAPEGRPFGDNFGTALKPLTFGARDPNGSIERAILRMFQAQDLYDFLISFHRLMTRAEVPIYLDLDLFEKQVTRRFQYEDTSVISAWTRSFYQNNTDNTDNKDN